MRIPSPIRKAKRLRRVVTCSRPPGDLEPLHEAMYCFKYHEHVGKEAAQCWATPDETSKYWTSKVGDSADMLNKGDNSGDEFEAEMTDNSWTAEAEARVFDCCVGGLDISKCMPHSVPPPFLYTEEAAPVLAATGASSAKLSTISSTNGSHEPRMMSESCLEQELATALHRMHSPIRLK
ncbi:hypothetical protein HDK77DRAFT_487904 [Phyllosticta capitalensis]